MLLKFYNDLESFNIDNLSYKDLKVDTSNKNVSFKVDIRDIMQGLLIVTGGLTGAETYFTVICVVNSQYNDIIDINSYATNGTVNVSNKYINIHSTYNIDPYTPISYIRIRLFA